MPITMVKETFVEMKGFKIFTKLYGELNARPTIVLDAGYGDYSKAWDYIISDLVKIANVLVYDRAGLGKSGKSPNPRTSFEMVKELNELLINLQIKPPFILVGHSFGGVNVRIYATEYPDHAAGVVLVDSTPEDYKERFLPTMSQEFQEAYNKQFIYEGSYDEFMESLEQLKQSKTRLNIPVIVLSAGKKDHYSKESQELWHRMQKEILDISDQSELIIVENSGHYIQNDDPAAVIQAVKGLNYNRKI